MIISHKYKYIFVELDRTGSTAIAKELCENYRGRPILWKHARYCDFLRIVKPEEKKYFVFSGVRNPLDVVVSYYHTRKAGAGNKDTHFLFHMKNNLKKHNFIKKIMQIFPYFLRNFMEIKNTFTLNKIK